MPNYRAKGSKYRIMTAKRFITATWKDAEYLEIGKWLQTFWETVFNGQSCLKSPGNVKWVTELWRRISNRIHRLRPFNKNKKYPQTSGRVCVSDHSGLVHNCWPVIVCQTLFISPPIELLRYELCTSTPNTQTFILYDRGENVLVTTLFLNWFCLISSGCQKKREQCVVFTWRLNFVGWDYTYFDTVHSLDSI